MPPPVPAAATFSRGPGISGRVRAAEEAEAPVPINGTCDARFAEVRGEFARNFSERGEVGAAVCVMVDGQPVVDLAGGWARPGTAWGPDTLVDYYSVGKAFLALLALQLVDAGRIGLDEPLEVVWPEFAAGGKDAATLRQALCHQAGVPAIRRPLSNDDLWQWDVMATALAETEAWWEPGTRHAYHTNTYGHLIGEVVRRVTGQTVRERLAAVAGPLQADVHVGVPASELHRCAEVQFVSVGSPLGAEADTTTNDTTTNDDTTTSDTTDLAALDRDRRMELLSYVNPPGYSSIGVVNTTHWRRAEVPSTNGHGTARGVARMYAALLEPGRLLSADLLAEATSPQSIGYCPILHEEVTFGLGFKPTVPRRPFGPNPGSFGHFGTGGAVGFADPATGVAFGYVMNHVIPRWQSTRNRALIDAVYQGLRTPD
jgi:CubicO group peptidase (beta-lactamase class C family)